MPCSPVMCACACAAVSISKCMCACGCCVLSEEILFGVFTGGDKVLLCCDVCLCLCFLNHREVIHSTDSSL